MRLMIYIYNKFLFEVMEAQVISSTPKEIKLSLMKTDIATLYIVQHELLKHSNIDFAGVILKHPLTNECWMKINSSKGNPIKEILKATDSAFDYANEIKKLFNSKIKVK